MENETTTAIQYIIFTSLSIALIGLWVWYIKLLQKRIYDLKQELSAWKAEAQINEMFLSEIEDLIPDEEKVTLIVDKDKEPSILKKIWWAVENALYK